MKPLRSITRILIILSFYILGCQFIFTQTLVTKQDIIGKWKYDSHLYRKVGRYGPREVDQIKSSRLVFMKDKVYFTNISFIDTCRYSKLEPQAFFDREDKESSYFLDGPLAIRYTKQQLSKFVRIDLNCKSNGFGTFYLNADTLILNSNGGVTFFFTKEAD